MAMDSIVEAKIKRYLLHNLRCDHTDIAPILFNMRKAARAAGHFLDAKFARAGLGAGPEARMAAEIVDRALVGGGGSASTEGQQKLVTDRWVLRTGPMV